jgi:hypothetical protein
MLLMLLLLLLMPLTLGGRVQRLRCGWTERLRDECGGRRHVQAPAGRELGGRGRWRARSLELFGGEYGEAGRQVGGGGGEGQQHAAHELFATVEGQLDALAWSAGVSSKARHQWKQLRSERATGCDLKRRPRVRSRGGEEGGGVHCEGTGPRRR